MTQQMQHATENIDRELQQAWADLRNTLSKVNTKVERTEERLAPKLIVSKHPIAISGVALALGFLIGLDQQRRFDWLAAGMLIGAAVASIAKTTE
jgi:ElaB/YqjD/DUF883 family membrane-anchored ribosome-binding protein